MQFYTKRQSPQNLFANIGRLQGRLAFRTIRSIHAKLSGQDAVHNKESKPYLYIKLALQACIMVPLTFIGALIIDLADIVHRGLGIAINLVLDAVNIATEVLTRILQLGALVIEKVIVHPVAWAYNKLCSKKPDGGQGPAGGAPGGENNQNNNDHQNPPSQMAAVSPSPLEAEVREFRRVVDEDQDADCRPRTPTF